MSGWNRARLIVYSLLAVVAGLVLAYRHAQDGDAASAPRTEPYAKLRGETAERIPMTVTLDPHGRLQMLDTHVISMCENGRTWKIRWWPDRPRIPFSDSDGRTIVHEVDDRPGPDGLPRHLDVWSRVGLDSHRTVASGDLRLVARFSYRGGKHMTCDSGYVHWSATGRGGPAGLSASSLADHPSPARRTFAARVDATCLRTFHAVNAAVAAARKRYARRSDAQRIAFETYVAGHAWQYRSLRALGNPPEAASLYRTWLDNFGVRVALERRELNRRPSAGVSIDFLKVRGNAVGQEFGLRGCTSNGPLY